VAEETVGAPKKVWREPDPFADFPKPSMNARAMSAGLHRVFRPRTYTEIGVSKGGSLARSRTKSIGVDPAFAITAELNCHVRLFRATSDDFFTRPDAFAHFDGVPVDLAYIDGMHLSEYALRDFMNVEKRMARTGVVALDDMLPRNPLEAARDRRTGPWAGDVYKIHQAPSERREMDEITSAEPSTGRPSGWSPKTALVTRSKIASCGVSSTIAISSSTTSRSASSSASEGAKTMSVITSRAVSRCSSRTRA
jgi:hypothetical protein